MSAAEVIELIKKLPPEEKREVQEFCAGPIADPSQVRYISRETLEKTADEIFKQHDTLFRRLAE